MEIRRPRRILTLGPPDAGVLSLLKELTGSSPPANDGSTAGLSHVWTLKTNYYSVELPIWIDEITNTDSWRVEFLKPEAKEVVTALGAWIYCFRRPVTEEDLDALKDALKAIEQVIQRAMGYSWDGTCLAVAMPQSNTPYLQRELEEWENVCREHGFEYVDFQANGRNEFGEPVGVPRLREALEATDWAADETMDLEELGISEDVKDEEISGTFAAEEAEMSLELLGMKTALAGGQESGTSSKPDEAEQVEELERMMIKLQAIRDTGSAMSEEERKKYAAKAVNEIMRNL